MQEVEMNVHLFRGLELAGMRAVARGAVACLLFGVTGAASAQNPSVQAELDALVKAAKAEGKLTFYWSSNEPVAKRVADAFDAKYAIKAGFVRLTSGPLLQRYSSEADSGNIAADLILTGGTTAVNYAAESIKKGWAEPIANANLPVIKSGEFPSRFNRGTTAIAQVSPWLISYNTEKLKPQDFPKDWRDLLDPKYKGQILLGDPRGAVTYQEFWTAMLDKYGEPFLAQIGAQSTRRYASGVPAVQALAAGEGTVHFPTIGSQTQAVKSKGAPVDSVMPEYNTGLEFHVMLTARAKSKNPNAARLFVNYVLSKEGNAVMNSDPGSLSVYGGMSLPKQYVAPSPDAEKNTARIAKLLGYE
jgi:iron(III) transport system substrate-binding protein